MMEKHAEELNRLLPADKTSEEMEQWERSVFDFKLSQCKGKVAILGAGQLGKKVAEVLRGDGRIEVVAICDNNEIVCQASHGAVIPTGEAVRLYGQTALFVIAIFDVLRCSKDVSENVYLKQMGCTNVIFYDKLFCKYGKQIFAEAAPIDWYLKPSEIMKEREEIFAAYDLIEDDSKELYIEILKSRLYDDRGWRLIHTAATQYFDELVQPSANDHVFIDCGAFDGDTLRAFIDYCDGRFKQYFAFEPMRESTEKLQKYVGTLREDIREKIKMLPYGVSDSAHSVEFESSGTSFRVKNQCDSYNFENRGEIQSCAAGIGANEIECVKLDDFFAGRKVSWLKMDIEGSEGKALQGARQLISANRPLLTICVYHRSNDLWKIPLLIRDINHTYRFFLRSYYSPIGCDTVCYALPAIKK